jgi:hypothetical protein
MPRGVKNMDTRRSHIRLNFYCQLIIVLLAAIALRLWMTPPAVLPSAQAQPVMDSGATRVGILRASEETTRLLSEIHRTLKGPLDVQVIEPAEQATPKRRQRPNG